MIFAGFAFLGYKVKTRDARPRAFLRVNVRACTASLLRHAPAHAVRNVTTAVFAPAHGFDEEKR